MASSTWQLSNSAMTIRVETDAAGNVRCVAPIGKKFLPSIFGAAQPLENLIKWLEKTGPVTKTLLRTTE